MALNFFKQSDIDNMDAKNIPEEFINYFKSASDDRKQQIIARRPDLAEELGYVIRNNDIGEESEENETELVSEAELASSTCDEFEEISNNLYEDKDLNKELHDGANPIEILTIPEGIKKCVLHRSVFIDKNIKYRTNGSTFSMVVKVCPECKRLYHEESRVDYVRKNLNERGIQNKLYDLDLSMKYLRTMMPIHELEADEKVYYPEIWIDEKPCCPVHECELIEIPCCKKYMDRKMEFKGYFCDICNKVMVRKAASHDLVDRCAIERVPEIEFELIAKRKPEKKPISPKEIKPDYFVEDGKRIEYTYSYNADCFKISEEDTIVVSDSIYCQLEGHNTEEVLALIQINQKKGGRKAYLFMVGYCAQCQKYYMDEVDYKVVYSIGRPEVTVLSDLDDDSYQITSGEVFNLEKKHLNKLESDIRRDVNNILNQPDYVAPGETESDKELHAKLQYRKENSKRKYGEVLSQLDSYTEKPYTYRVDISNDDETETYYVGATDVILSDGKRVISYNDDFGRELVNYQTLKIKKGGRKYNIKLSRQFDIDRAELFGYMNLRTDEDIIFKNGITDPFLVRVLNMRKKQHNLIDIIATIQENQNRIVDEKFTENIIVQGCAGSGKTMVLLHRLSSLKYKRRDFDFSSEALILTPNDQFSLHIKGLAEGLQIGNIKRSSVEAYYLEMLMMYSSEFKPANKIVSEMMVKQNFVDYIYSDQFLFEFDKAYEEVIKARNDLAENLYEIMKKMDQTKIFVDLNDNKNVFAQLTRLISVLQGKVAVLEQEIDENKKLLVGFEDRKTYIISRLPELEKFSKGIVNEALPRVYTKIGKAVSDRQNTIDHLKNQIVTLEENLKGVQGSFILFGKKVKIEELEEKIKKANSALKSETRKQEIENRVFNIPQSGNNDEFVIDWFRQVMKHVPDVQDEVRLCENTRSEFYKLSKESESIDESIAVAKVKYEATKAKDYSEEIKSSITQLKERAEQYNLLGTYQKIFDLATASYRKENDIRTIRGKCHRYDLYAQLIFAIKFFGMTYGNTKFMCVDEAQDLALNEYKLLKKLNSNNLVFNLYGDVNQLIKPNRGVTDWSEIEKILPSKEFVLNENYRNTNQITRFCNSSFNMDVLQTGVDGAQVREISRSELEGELEMLNITTERLAILVPRTVQKGKYLKKELLSEQKKSIIDDSLDNGHISLMYVDEVKGIEFDKVYVIANKMARNEKYIAYTRALSELIIVVDENVPDQKDEDLNDVDEAE